jgi:hypothetical protein
MNYWLWPLPPAGPLRWVAEWPEMGAPETSVEVDASVLSAAAAESEQLWEVDPEDEEYFGGSSSTFTSTRILPRPTEQPPEVPS